MGSCKGLGYDGYGWGRRCGRSVFASADASGPFALSLSPFLMLWIIFSQTNRALSLFLSSGGYCAAGSSAVIPCPAGAIDWVL
jgi:hypothetical protein